MKRRSSVAGVLMVFLLVLGVVALVVGGCAYNGYNRAIRLDESVRSGWAQVENILQSRFDLIPNLVETVKGYAEHEKDIFTAVADARTKYFAADQSGNRGEQVEAAAGFERALSRLLVLQEKYPELKAQDSFRQLMDALEGTERRLAVERMRYNESVAALNTYTRGLLGRLFASWAGVKEAEYFEAPEAAREAPKVDFGG